MRAVISINFNDGLPPDETKAEVDRLLTALSVTLRHTNLHTLNRSIKLYSLDGQRVGEVYVVPD